MKKIFTLVKVLILIEAFFAENVVCQTTTTRMPPTTTTRPLPTTTSRPLQCFVSGECTNSDLVDISTTVDEIECLAACQNETSCQWFSFTKSNDVCHLFADCTELSTVHCSDCVSGENDCSVPQCWVQGECEGSLLYSQDTSSMNSCLQMCKSNPQCNWYTYFAPGDTCFLLSSCDTLDASCEDCISGERFCLEMLATTSTSTTTTTITRRTTTTQHPTTTAGPAPTTTQRTTTTTLPPGVKLKVMVAFGLAGDYLSDVEIVDLSSPSTTCQNFPDFPIENYYATGGLILDDKPLICGGRFNESTCYLFEDQTWKTVVPLSTGRHGHAISKSPYRDDGSMLFVTGGQGLNSSEILTETSWKRSVSLPVEIYYHCMVTKSSTKVIAIGGYQNNQESGKTFVFSSESGSWSSGPVLFNPRSLHSCGSIRKSSLSEDKSIIVVGGEHGGHSLKSVEILDYESTEWRRAPDLPAAFHSAALVTDSYGAVLVIGGYVTTLPRLDTIYKFPHGGVDASWEKLPQTLKTGRYAHVALLIPDGLTNCTFV